MAVDPQFAYNLAEQLTTIPDCPRSEASTKTLAMDLIRLCRDDREAHNLVNAMRDEWITWKGTAGLIEVLQGLRRGPGAVPLERRVVDLGPKPVVNCAACQDWGYVWRAGVNVYCSCAQGARLEAEDPGLLDTLNRKGSFKGMPALQAVPAPRPITEADLEQAFLQRKKDTEGMITRARAVLADETRSSNEKELARETLRMLGAEE